MIIDNGDYHTSESFDVDVARKLFSYTSGINNKNKSLGSYDLRRKYYPTKDTITINENYTTLAKVIVYDDLCSSNTPLLYFIEAVSQEIWDEISTIVMIAI